MFRWVHAGEIKNHDSHWINCGREEVITLQNPAAFKTLECTVLNLYRHYPICVFGIIHITHLCVCSLLLPKDFLFCRVLHQRAVFSSFVLL